MLAKTSCQRPVNESHRVVRHYIYVGICVADRLTNSHATILQKKSDRRRYFQNCATEVRHLSSNRFRLQFYLLQFNSCMPHCFDVHDMQSIKGALQLLKVQLPKDFRLDIRPVATTAGYLSPAQYMVMSKERIGLLLYCTDLGYSYCSNGPGLDLE